MSLKTKKVGILFISVLFLGFISVLFNIPIVNANENYEPTIKANWLYVQPSNFVDKSPNSWETKIQISSGGGDMWDFENLGMVSSSDTEILYKSKATFGFEVTVHTNVDFRSVYPNINLAKHNIEHFFTINRAYFGYDTTTIHNVEWNSIELGAMRVHDYDGYVPITVGIRDILGNTGSISLNGEVFDTPAYTADVIKTTITSINSGEVGGYGDLFTNVNDVTEGKVTFTALGDDFSANERAVIDYYNNRNLGWKAGDIEKGQTLQQSMIGGSQRGSEFTSAQSLSSYTFSLNTQLQPEVYEFVQYNDITSARILYYAWGFFAGNIDTVYSPATRQVKRIIGIHTINNFIHWEFEVEVEFYATVQSTAELTSAILNDPYLRAGDMVWDSSFTGDYKVDTILTQQDNVFDVIGEFFEDLFGSLSGIINFVIMIIIIAVGLYIFIKIGIPLISRRIKRGPKKKD